ncbi:MAG: hypothetical protein U0168_27765 [Nannocystaceae bacterium]
MDDEDAYPVPPPDLGANAIVCGMPGEVAATNEDFAALEGCELFLGRLVMLNANATVLAPLASLRVIREDLAGGGGNDALESLHGLERVEWVGSLHFSRDGLRDLAGLVALTGIEEGFQLFDMPFIEDCSGLGELRTVGGGVSFVINDELSRLDGLSGLEWIGGDLRIEDNPKLETLDGLSSLRQVDGDVTIILNPLLSAAEVDAFVGRLVIGGTVHLD